MAPAVNRLGMIGQYQEVDILVKQAVFAITMGQRFSDKLLVVPAGVGKSTRCGTGYVNPSRTYHV